MSFLLICECFEWKTRMMQKKVFSLSDDDTEELRLDVSRKRSPKHTRRQSHGQILNNDNRFCKNKKRISRLTRRPPLIIKRSHSDHIYKNQFSSSSSSSSDSGHILHSIAALQTPIWHKTDKGRVNTGWFYLNSKGETRGPVTIKTLKEMYNTNQLRDEHYLWDGISVMEWTQLRKIKWLREKLDMQSSKNVKCIGCGQLFQAKHYKKHREICQMYPIKCSECNKQILRKHYDLHLIQEGSHKTIRCKYYPLCDLKILRKEYHNHITNKCKQRIIKCPYHKFGCHHRMKAIDLNEHLTEYMLKHNELQLEYFQLIVNSHKYIYVEGATAANRIRLNGLYERMGSVDSKSHKENAVNNRNEGSENEMDDQKADDFNENGDNTSSIRLIYKKANSSICIRYNFKYRKWIFQSKDKNTLLMQTDGAKNGENSQNPCNVLFEWNLKLNGFTDLYLFRQLNLLQSPMFIEIIGRKGINFEMNGVYKKQSDLHCGKPCFIKLSDINIKNGRQWVIRYYYKSELWLIDKRGGLRNDDIANGIGHGDTRNPLQITKWEIHNGETFVVDNDIQIREYNSL